MIYFHCPHCLYEYHQDDLFEQEQELIESPIPLLPKSFTLTCSNCFEIFELQRTVMITYTTTAQNE